MTTARTTAFALALAGIPLGLPAQQAAEELARQLAVFGKASAATQDAVLAAVATALQQEDARASLLLALADAAKAAGAERTRRLPVHHPRSSPPRREQPDVVLPAAVRYVFGVGVVEAVDGAATGVDAERLHREVAIEQALRGMVPGADAVLAVAERLLDTDTAGDRFAAFLQAWRNGTETFYEAIDRTAGTPDSVFFYDAMLADFAATFAGRTLGSSLQARHDALQDAFLAYRQYRGFREAVAYALVLPPDVPLPARLRRYETAPLGTYSLRQQVVMLCELLGGDPRKVIEAIVATAPSLPQPIWSAAYDPYAAWNKVFADAVPPMVAAAGDTDAFLAQSLRRRSESAAAIQQAARQAMDAAGGKPTPGR